LGIFLKVSLNCARWGYIVAFTKSEVYFQAHDFHPISERSHAIIHYFSSFMGYEGSSKETQNLNCQRLWNKVHSESAETNLALPASWSNTVFTIHLKLQKMRVQKHIVRR
jgi:hypothetical protein